MDVEFQTWLRNKLLEAWADGDGDAKQADFHAGNLTKHIYYDEDVARFHLPTILLVADGSLHVPNANMILHNCYLRGSGVRKDQAEALRRLELAIHQGSEIAKWFLASYMLNNEKLSEVLPRDPVRALANLRELARKADNISTMSLARRTFSSYVATNLHFEDISAADREIVTWYANDIPQVSDIDYLPLAIFFALGQSDGDYAGDSYKRSRDLLIAGSASGSPQVRDVCNAQLNAWGVKPVSKPEPTTVQKAVDTVKVAGMLGGVAATLVLWSVVGLFLLSIVAAINAVMLPVVLGVLAVCFLVSRLRR